MSRQFERAGAEVGDEVVQRSVAPGKRTRAESLPARAGGAVQLKEQTAAPSAAPAGDDPFAMHLAGDAAGAGPAASNELLDRVGGSATALRTMLGADPGLAGRLPTLVAAGEAGAQLNALLAQAFPAGGGGAAASAQTEGDKGGDHEKDPTDPTVALPAARPGNKKLSKGTMKWNLKAAGHSKAEVEVDFKPDETKVDAKAVSFVQTVVSKLGTNLSYAGTSNSDPVGKKTEYAPYEESTSKKRVDHFAGAENDPFYGAEWDQSGKKWKKESTSWAVGASTKGGASSSAKMTDGPSKSPIRIGHGDFAISFETVPTVLETREPLGSLSWGWTCKDAAQAPLVLTGGEDKDCVDTPSADVDKAHDQFFAAKFDQILDSFVVDKADLTSGHEGQLDGIVTKMTKTATLKVQLGGAADLSEKDPDKVSLDRANAARDYLIGKGIDGGRIEVQSYGSAWARTQTTAGKDEPKNRRVQAWVR